MNTKNILARLQAHNDYLNYHWLQDLKIRIARALLRSTIDLEEGDIFTLTKNLRDPYDRSWIGDRLRVTHIEGNRIQAEKSWGYINGSRDWPNETWHSIGFFTFVPGETHEIARQ